MHYIISRIVCFFLIMAALASPSAAKRVALVIGNSAYEHVPSLTNPKNDANAVASVLETLGFSVLKGVDLDRSSLETKVREFARAIRGADTALFFYAGHGLQVNGQNYLAPVDAKLGDEADLEFEAVRIENVLKQMEREPRTNLVFLDACRDNPLARNLARSMGTRSAAIGRGLARVETGIGTMISFATQPGNVALDGSGKNSPFTEALLKHIETPGLDVAQMMRRVRVDVIKGTANRQVPWSNSSLTGDFFFAGRVSPSTAQAAPLTPAAEAWGGIKDSRSAAVLESFIARFPNSVFADLATARLKELKETQVAVGVFSGDRTGRGGRAFKPGHQFTDCDGCPKMVVVPAGRFLMGAGEGVNLDEPRREVTIRRSFAVGKFEVTRQQFEAFARETKHRPGEKCYIANIPAVPYERKTQRKVRERRAGPRQILQAGNFRKPGIAQGGDHPVVCVNWDDAKAYTSWLSRKTGKTYRLLSEAEWEFAARAGTTTPFYTGLKITDSQANFNAESPYNKYSPKGKWRRKTMPVGSFAANGFGLHDMHGNVAEWLEDCWNVDMAQAPTDGSAWTSGDCGNRNSRGGSWFYDSTSMLSAIRGRRPTVYRSDDESFRVARDLSDIELGLGGPSPAQ